MPSPESRLARSAALTLSLLATLALLPACKQGDGPAVERAREVPAFSRIESGAGILVSVTIGPAAPVVVRAQENIQDRITTGVRDGTLRIEANDDFTVADPVRIEVTMPSLDAVTLSGGAAVEVDGLETDAIAVSLSGGARATISGVAASVTLIASGGSVASLADLDAEHVTVDLAGGAQAEVHATGSVQGSASGGARLTVSGDASVDVDTSGGAQVTQG